MCGDRHLPVGRIATRLAAASLLALGSGAFPAPASAEPLDEVATAECSRSPVFALAVHGGAAEDAAASDRRAREHAEAAKRRVAAEAEALRRELDEAEARVAAAADAEDRHKAALARAEERTRASATSRSPRARRRPS